MCSVHLCRCLVHCRTLLTSLSFRADNLPLPHTLSYLHTLIRVALCISCALSLPALCLPSIFVDARAQLVPRTASHTLTPPYTTCACIVCALYVTTGTPGLSLTYTYRPLTNNLQVTQDNHREISDDTRTRRSPPPHCRDACAASGTGERGVLLALSTQAVVAEAVLAGNCHVGHHDLGRSANGAGLSCL
jgi:hypothetical protein